MLLQILREAAGLSAKDVAEMMDVPEGVIQLLEIPRRLGIPFPAEQIESEQTLIDLICAELGHQREILNACDAFFDTDTRLPGPKPVKAGAHPVAVLPVFAGDEDIDACGEQLWGILTSARSMRGVVGRYAYDLIASGRAVSAIAVDPDAFGAWAEEHLAEDDDDVSRLAALFTWAAVSYVDSPSRACAFRLTDEAEEAPFPFDDPVLAKHHLRVIKAAAHDRAVEEESDLLNMIADGAPVSRVFDLIDSLTRVGIDDEMRLYILEDLRLTVALARFMGNEREEKRISEDKFKRLLKRIKTRTGRREVVEERYLEQYNAMAPFP